MPEDALEEVRMKAIGVGVGVGAAPPPRRSHADGRGEEIIPLLEA